MGREPISFLPDDNGYFKPLIAAHGGILAFYGVSSDNKTSFPPGGRLRHGHGGPM